MKIILSDESVENYESFKGHLTAVLNYIWENRRRAAVVLLLLLLVVKQEETFFFFFFSRKRKVRKKLQRVRGERIKTKFTEDEKRFWQEKPNTSRGNILPRGERREIPPLPLLGEETKETFYS